MEYEDGRKNVSHESSAFHGVRTVFSTVPLPRAVVTHAYRLRTKVRVEAGAAAHSGPRARITRRFHIDEELGL